MSTASSAAHTPVPGEGGEAMEASFVEFLTRIGLKGFIGKFQENHLTSLESCKLMTKSTLISSLNLPDAQAGLILSEVYKSPGASQVLSPTILQTSTLCGGMGMLHVHSFLSLYILRRFPCIASCTFLALVFTLSLSLSLALQTLIDRFPLARQMFPKNGPHKLPNETVSSYVFLCYCCRICAVICVIRGILLVYKYICTPADCWS